MAGEQARPSLTGQVTGLLEVPQRLSLVGPALVMSSDNRAVRADGRMGPALRGLVAQGLCGGEHGLPGCLAVGPVPLAPQEPGLAGKDLRSTRDEALRGCLGGRAEQNLVLGLGPVHQLWLARQLLGYHALRRRRRRG